MLDISHDIKNPLTSIVGYAELALNKPCVLLFTILYGGVLLFIPYYKKMDKKPAGTYFAFVLAFAIEMHGIPFSMYSWKVILQQEFRQEMKLNL